MRRRSISLLGALFLGATTVALVPAHPASATGVCIGVLGAATTSAPMFYPVTAFSSAGTLLAVTQRSSTTANFTVNFGIVGCVTPVQINGFSASGTVNGWCGHSSATGVTSDGFRFAWISAGTVLVATGGVTGVASVVPDLLAGESCLSGADGFIVNAVGLKAHCALKSKGLTTLIVPIPPTNTLTGIGTQGLHVTTQPVGIHYWTKLCVPSVNLV